MRIKELTTCDPVPVLIAFVTIAFVLYMAVAAAFTNLGKPRKDANAHPSSKQTIAP